MYAAEFVVGDLQADRALERLPVLRDGVGLLREAVAPVAERAVEQLDARSLGLAHVGIAENGFDPPRISHPHNLPVADVLSQSDLKGVLVGFPPFAGDLEAPAGGGLPKVQDEKCRADSVLLSGRPRDDQAGVAV